MSKVTLDRETFKALASETRLQVLHALDERRKTGSELARELGLNKATVHEHLGILEATGLVQKKDEGRKWVYWELTWDGSKLLHPGQGAIFSVLLGLSVLATGGGITMLGFALGWWLQGSPTFEGLADDQADTAAAPEEGAPLPEQLTQADGGGGFFDDGGWISIALFLTTLVAVGLMLWLRRRK